MHWHSARNACCRPCSRCYSAWASIAGNHASLVDTIELLDQTLPTELLQPTPAPLLIQNAIRFDTVRFRYTSDGPWVLDGVNLTIS